ncbi:MFS transporter [Aestuariimicrobium ganziense]|uniref:hypothetical protein n=1 Tax=Aestuariimicrobium ganziense TaxID=2773677 RepID=UPI0019414B26|nr:hypothetical protein [Aestuariimicrobium ganziense]
MALSGNFWVAVAFLWTIGAAQSVAAPVRAAWLNREIDSSARATSLSIIGQADALGQIAGGPGLGMVASRWGIPAGLLAASAVKTPAVALLASLRGRRAVPPPIVEP